MAGLLYKDFVAVKGKMQVLALTVATFILLVFRIFIKSETADALLSALVALGPALLLCYIVFSWENKVLIVDEGKKKKEYLLSMPVSKEQYVASKYWILLIVYYVILSVAEFWAMIYMIQGSKEDGFYKLVEDMAGLYPAVVCMCLALTAVELPFFIVLGTKIGQQIKTGITIGLFFLSAIFLFFGDLTVLDSLNLANLLLYLEEHVEVLLGLQVFAPIISVCLYYASYRITCYFFGRREWDGEA